MKKICTVIVLLKDNHQRTINLLRHSIFDDFEYILLMEAIGTTIKDYLMRLKHQIFDILDLHKTTALKIFIKNVSKFAIS